MDAVSITTITIALIAFFSLIVTSIVAPVMMVRSQNRARLAEKAADAAQALIDKEAERQRLQRDKDEDRARLADVAAKAEAVAAKAEEATLRVADTARLLAEGKATAAAQEAEKARLLVESNQKIADAVAASAKVTNDKVDGIHGIVNSGATAQLQSELNISRGALLLAREIRVLKKDAGLEANGASATLIAVTEARITELETTIAARLKQAREAQQLELQRDNK